MISTEENKENEDPQDIEFCKNCQSMGLRTTADIDQKYYWVCEESRKMPNNYKSRAITKLDGVDIHVYVEFGKIQALFLKFFISS
jgi:hypothetical protein